MSESLAPRSHIERILAAAFRRPCGHITYGLNHDEASYDCCPEGDWRAPKESGFVTSAGRFVDHEEALQVSRQAKQLSEAIQQYCRENPSVVRIVSETFWEASAEQNLGFGQLPEHMTGGSVVRDPLLLAIEELSGLARSLQLAPDALAPHIHEARAHWAERLLGRSRDAERRGRVLANCQRMARELLEEPWEEQFRYLLEEGVGECSLAEQAAHWRAWIERAAASPAQIDPCSSP